MTGGLAAAITLLGCATAPRVLHPRAVQHQAAGAESLGRGQLDRAAGQFSLALDYEPRMAEAENGLGLVALRRGATGEAEDRFRAALALNDDLAEAHLNLGSLLLARGEREEALGEMRAALAIDPGYGSARLGAGETLLRLGRLEEARWELAKLCEIDPDSAAAHAAHALVLARMDRIAAAETAARRALDLDARLPAAHRARAEILRRRGDAAGAVSELRIVVAAEPDSTDDRLSLVTALAAAGDLDAAARGIEALAEAAPRRPEVAFTGAFVALRQDRPDQAALAARRALELRAAYPEARLLLAEALYRGGRGDEGRRELERFLAEAPPRMAEERQAAERHLREERLRAR